MNVFEAVKQSVTTRQAAEHYGIHVGRNGMACCPFHHDKTPSMKLDRRYHCFGCGADGDVIDFAAALYGLGKKEAAVQLAQDFGLSYEDWKPPGKEKKPKPRQKSPEEQFQEAKNRCFRILADYLHLLRAWRKDYVPHSPEEAFHVVLFVPFGFFLPLLYKKYHHIKTVVLTGFLFSLSVEIVQMFGWGSTDINDLITNTVGVCLGYLVYYLLSKVLPNNLRKQFQSENVNDMVEVPLFAIYTFIIMVTVQPWVIHSLLNIG